MIVPCAVCDGSLCLSLSLYITMDACVSVYVMVFGVSLPVMVSVVFHFFCITVGECVVV